MRDARRPQPPVYRSAGFRKTPASGHLPFQKTTTRIELTSNSKFARVNRISSKAWIIGIILSLVSSSASLVNLRAQSRRFALQAEVSRREGREKGPEAAEADAAERRKQGRALLVQRQNIMSQLVTDAFDFWIPANNLGYSNLNEGVVGLLGATTSYMALQKCWTKAAPLAKA
jgi:peroxin-11B